MFKCPLLIVPYLLLLIGPSHISYANSDELELANPNYNENAISPFLAKLSNNGSDSQNRLRPARVHRPVRDCRWRPWICRQGLPLLSPILCCRNQCVNVTRDPNNCGVCRISCPPRWKCCGGFCVDVRVNPLNCGDCNHRCPFPSLCLYGLCSSEEPSPPPPMFGKQPTPSPQKHPKPNKHKQSPFPSPPEHSKPALPPLPGEEEREN